MRVETITPQKATEWLAKNKNNRPLSTTWVGRLATVIKNGEFILNGESIKFNCDGSILDGQHRLHAVVRAGKSIQSYVMYGLDKSAFDTIDQGRKRSLKDLLAVANHKNCTTLSAALLWAEALQDGTRYGDKLAHSSHEHFARLDAMPGLIESVNLISKMRMSNKDFGGFSGGFFAALHYVCSQVDAAKATEFCERVIGGEGLNKSMPEYQLRAAIIENSRSAKKMTSEMQSNLVVKAWNAAYTGTTKKLLKTSPGEVRPKIAGLAE